MNLRDLGINSNYKKEGYKQDKAGMHWSVGTERNAMKLYPAYISLTERKEWTCGAEERNSLKNTAAYF